MNGSHPQILRLLLITALALLLTGPVLAARVPPDARDAARAELDAQAESTIQDMIERHPELEEALGNAVG